MLTDTLTIRLLDREVVLDPMGTNNWNGCNGAVSAARTETGYWWIKIGVHSICIRVCRDTFEHAEEAADYELRKALGWLEAMAGKCYDAATLREVKP